MNLKLSLLSLAALASTSAFAGTPAAAVQETQPPVIHIYRSNAFDIETGGLWEIGHNTPIAYQLWETQFSWRTKRMFGYDFDNGSSISVRNRFTAIGTWVASGPENHYFGFSASPSVEWWNKSETFSIYAGAGGGIGVIDSQNVVGGQGQDRTLNWFAQLGVQSVLTETLSLRAACMFQHMSNGGATNPNPGIDALGFSLGCSWRF